MAQKGYRRGKKCPDCGKPIGDRASKCKGCAKKSPSGACKPILAWRYDCPCGIAAYSFDGTPTIRDSAGHDVRRGPRVIYNGGKFYDYCPACGASAGGHSFERRDEMFYVVSCLGND